MNNPKTKSSLESPNQKAIKRLLKNKPAIFGIGIIGIAIFVAIFGYFLAPDSTPNANDQITEIAFENPGFRIQMLAVRKNQPIQKVGFFRRMIYGNPNTNQLFPINNFHFIDDTISIEIYKGMSDDGNKIKGPFKEFNLADVAFPISKIEKNVEEKNDEITYYDLENHEQKASVSDLQQKIEREINH